MTSEKQKRTHQQHKWSVNLQEINENMTILLGIASAQEQNIKEVREDVETIKERTERIEHRLDGVETTMSEHTSLLTQILERLPKQL